MIGQEIYSSLRGLREILKRNPAAELYFNTSLNGFWFSFVIGIVLMLAYHGIIFLWGQNQATPEMPQIFLPAQILNYILGWVTWPLAIAYLAPMLDRRPRFFPYIVMYNWFSFFEWALRILVSFAMLSFPNFAVLIMAAMVGIVSYYRWFVARIGLKISGSAAISIVFLDIFLAFFIFLMMSGSYF